jgi:TPR repeat protein
MARLLFWGSQGVKRNLQAAVEYYRMSAQSQDPVALHDLGIVLLKVQGIPLFYPYISHIYHSCGGDISEKEDLVSFGG